MSRESPADQPRRSSRRQRRPVNPFALAHDPQARSHPLAAGQQRLWWQRQLDSATDRYHIHGGWRFADGLDPRTLAAALAALVRRHEILRTAFVADADGRTSQHVLDPVEIPVTWAGRDWRAAVDRAGAEPFDLARPPLFRVVAAEPDDGPPALYMVLHHIVTDRWSMDLLPRDLFELYDAARTGREPDLPELAVQYGDYAAWQQRALTPERRTELADWWRSTLSGQERAELPSDRPRRPAPDGSGATVAVDLPADVTAQLTDLAWGARATPFIVVTAALTRLLGEATGQGDVTIGAIVSDRPHGALRDLIGFFVNTVPLRVDLSAPSLTFRQALTATREAWLAADAHQDAPFEEIVGALRAGSDPGRHPLFDVAVNHGGDHTTLTGRQDAPVWWRPGVPETARFDLSLTTMVVDGRLRATFLYLPDLFDRGPIAALAERYVRLLEHAIAEPDRPMDDFILVDAAELAPRDRCDGPGPAPSETVVELFQARAARHPDVPAVVAPDGQLTYSELNARANRLARRLVSHGAGPERVVGVCLEHSVDRAVVLLAVAKSGAAYLPLDPDFPAERLRFLLTDAAAILTVVSPALRSALPADIGFVMEFGGGDPDLSQTSATDLVPVRARPDNLAYLISTSGSTGTPKSVAVPHRALSRLAVGAAGYLAVGPGDTFLQAGPLTFDVAVLEWAPLVHGGRVAIAALGTWLENAADMVRQHGVTTLKLVSPQLDLLVERDIDLLAGLRQLIVGGDVVRPGSFAQARLRLPGCEVLASYGPTENTVLSTVFAGPAPAHRVPIGHAVPYTSIYILDRNLRPTPVGMRGEIYLAGAGLARGYHGRPGRTAQAFVADPYGPPGSRMYRTGDVGRRLPDGEIDFLGRADRQLKIRGFRIETGEVEHALLRQPGVTAVVVTRAELATGPCLVAYLTTAAHVTTATEPAAPLDHDALRRALRTELPAYMVPDHIIELPRIPLTAHNKVDRAALPPISRVADRPEEQISTVGDYGLVSRVAQAWSEVSGTALTSESDFFNSGGHSLMVPRATAAIRNLLGREIPLRLMMEHRTPASYAAALALASTPDLAAATREHRLVRETWHSAALGGDRRVDLFVTPGAPDAIVKHVLVVPDGSEFVDIMRLPALLDRLASEGGIGPTAAVFLSPADSSVRRAELLDPGYVDVLADELLPHLRAWLGARLRAERAVVLGASLGAVVALRAALRRPDRFAGAAALSGPLSEHRLGPGPEGPDGTLQGPASTLTSARLFLAAGDAEADLSLDDGLSLLEANQKTAVELDEQGNTVRFEHGAGGHTYAAWEALLPEAVTWTLQEGTEHHVR